MRRDAEQGLGHLADALLIEVLQVLTGQQHRRFLLPYTLQAVSDVLDGGRVGQPDIQLIQSCHGIAHGQKLVGHEGQYIEEHGVADILGGTEHSLDTEHQEAAGGNVGMPIEELGVGALAHGVQSQQYLLQEFLGVELVLTSVVGLELLLNQVIEVGKDGIVLRAHPAEVGLLVDAEFPIQLGQHDLDGIDMRVAEILIGPEEVLQEGDVLGQQGAFAKGLRRIGGVGVTTIIPALGFQHIDDVLSGHEVSKTAAHRLAHFLLFVFSIQRNDGLAGLQQVQNEQLHEIGLALTGVAKDQDVGRGLVLIPLVEIHQNVAAVFVFADVEALGIQLAGVVEGIEIRHAGGGQYSFKLDAECVVTAGIDAAEALLLTEQELIHIQLAPHQLRQYIGLEQLEVVVVGCGQLDVHGAVEQRLTVSVHGGHQGGHILKVALGGDRLLQVVGVGAVQAVLVGGVLNDALFLSRSDLPGVDPQGDAVLFSQMTEDGLLIRAGRVFTKRPDAAVGVAADEMIRHEADHRGGDHIQKGFDGCLLAALRNRSFRFLCQNGCLLFSVEASRPWSGTPPRPVMN